MIKITSEQLERIAPNIRAGYRAAFAPADAVLAHYGINDNGLRLAHFMAQVISVALSLKATKTNKFSKI